MTCCCKFSDQFTVTTSATDLTLLTVAELRVAAGLDPADASQDAVLAQYGEQAAAEIASDCAIASDGVDPPTLRSEVCEDVFRLCCSEKTLQLSRHHVSDVASIKEDGTELDVVEWIIDRESGRLTRLVNDAVTCWSAHKVEVEYTAGFVVVPAELKAEAMWRVTVKYSEGSRDPLERRRRVEIPGVRLIETDYQIGGLERLTGDGLPSESERRLRRFMTQSMVG